MTHAQTLSNEIAWAIIAVAAIIEIFQIVAMWKVFRKAGRPGWAAIIPIYNTYTIVKIINHSGWETIFSLVPIANTIFTAYWLLVLAKRFGKGTGFGIGLILISPIFWGILGFGDATYHPEREETQAGSVETPLVIRAIVAIGILLLAVVLWHYLKAPNYLLGALLVLAAVSFFIKRAPRLNSAVVWVALAIGFVYLAILAGIFIFLYGFLIPSLNHKLDKQIKQLDANEKVFAQHIAAAEQAWEAGDNNAVISEANAAFPYSNGNSDTAIVYYWKAVGENNLNQLPAAEADAKKAISLYAHYGPSHATLALIYDKQKNLPAALDEANQAIQINPTYAWGYNVRAVVEFDQGNRSAAITDEQKAIQLDPTQAQFKENLKTIQGG